jgi:Transposase DDE domain
MSSSLELYNRLVVTIEPLVSVSNMKQLANWLWITVGIIQANSVALSKIATCLPGAALAESRVATIRRWLMNCRVDIWAFYRPILQQTLQGWCAVHAIVILDGVTVFGDRWQIFRLSLAHGRRAIPLVWMVLPTEGLTQAEILEPMLQRAAEFLNPRVRQVTLIADRGFRDCDWAELCEKLGWNYVIRLANNTCLGLADGQWLHLDRIDVSSESYRAFQNVLVARSVQWRANVTVTRTHATTTGESEIVAVMSNRPAGRSRLREYAQRMDIDESFRDDKSGGFDLEHTRLQHPERLERLLLAVALATLWCHELGEQVLAKGEARRRQIDPGAARELSLFQLGLRWLKRCLANALELLPVFLARLSPMKLKPVINRAIVKV